MLLYLQFWSNNINYDWEKNLQGNKTWLWFSLRNINKKGGIKDMFLSNIVHVTLAENVSIYTVD